jgi:seryl-tRNA synthetase
MADFTPINTQEELDKVIGQRLARERETVTKELNGQIAERDEKIKGFQSQIDDLNKKLETANAAAGKIPELESKVKKYETDSVKTRIAHEVGLPYEMAGRLSGDDEKTIRADAEGLKKIMGDPNPAPLKSTETGTEGLTGAWGQMLQSMKGE